VSFYTLIDEALGQSLARSLWAFRPELAICATIVVLLLARMLVPRWKTSAFYLMLLGTTAALFLVASSLVNDKTPDALGPTFTGLLMFDGFSIFMRGLLLFFTLLFAALTQLSGVPDVEDAAEFYVLVLGALLGMCLMVSANHMVIVVLGVEMASVPSYVLAGILKFRRQSTEASLKYAVFGAGAAGVMLYGISLLAGVLGSAHIPTMTARLAELIQLGISGEQSMVLALGGLMIMVGLAFKLSAFPFHFWAPDVFEGAPAEVGAFLSVASKAAALGLLVRLTLGFGFINQSVPLMSLEPVRQYLGGLIALVAAVTCTFGNLAAYGQKNMKRLLAYSTIAHAGYMMMPVAAAVAAIGPSLADLEAAQTAIASMGFYVVIYLFMNLGAFSVVAFLRNALGSEQIADYAGLVRRSPGLAVCMTIILFSLVGLPPLAGFVAKFSVLAVLFNSRLLALLIVGGVNTVLSLFYYLRVVRVMLLQPVSDLRPAPEIPLLSIPGAFCAVLTLPLVVLFVWWNALFNFIYASAGSLLH
jgi:NADH-quinone oxidoreductase subunit N